ncbi:MULTISPECIES: acetyltransferase [Xenorhabdus]|uniref:acetyltransferase n=1 Tax=Xenorhabdus TaxID=626 RepID=UPI001ABFD7D4|nr:MULTISPECIES: acetyltransferase [Xenorhabdus]
MIVDKEGFLLAYFSLTFKEISTSNFAISKTKIKKSNGISKNENSLKVYLIGQIAKNFLLRKNPIKLKDILFHINVTIEKNQELTGGRITIFEIPKQFKKLSPYMKKWT